MYTGHGFSKWGIGDVDVEVGGVAGAALVANTAGAGDPGGIVEFRAAAPTVAMALDCCDVPPPTGRLRRLP